MQNFRGMKFSRMLPRPLETFHSVDEKRPRITFTKYIRGDSQRFRWKVARSFLSFFLSLPCVWNTILWLVFWKKKKKEVSNPLSVVVSRRTSEKTIEWKGGKENEEGEARSLLLSTMRETRHPPPPGRGTNQPWVSPSRRVQM